MPPPPLSRIPPNPSRQIGQEAGTPCSDLAECDGPPACPPPGAERGWKGGGGHRSDVVHRRSRASARFQVGVRRDGSGCAAEPACSSSGAAVECLRPAFLSGLTPLLQASPVTGGGGGVSLSGSGWKHPPLPRKETELMHDLKNDVAEIHHEMSELRKMLETCMDGQSKLQNLIRGEVSSMIYDSVGISYLLHSSQRAPTKRGTCCVCHEMQVDSLLYRCGHMCTCYKCAQELQWGTGRCPVCRAQIDDVVRAFFETTTS